VLTYNPLENRIESPAYARLMRWDRFQCSKAVRIAHGLAGMALGLVALLPWGPADGEEPAVYRVGLGLLLMLGAGFMWLRYRRHGRGG